MAKHNTQTEFMPLKRIDNLFKVFGNYILRSVLLSNIYLASAIPPIYRDPENRYAHNLTASSTLKWLHTSLTPQTPVHIQHTWHQRTEKLLRI